MIQTFNIYNVDREKYSILQVVVIECVLLLAAKIMDLR